jgi:hypothetical protein
LQHLDETLGHKFETPETLENNSVAGGHTLPVGELQ